MKLIVVMCAVIAVAEPFTYFTTANEHLDVASIMSDPIQVKYYMDCFVGRSACDNFSFSYKKNMAEAILTACFRCTDAQKHMWNIFLPTLKEKYPTEFSAFQRNYDPMNQLLDGFMEAVKDY